MNGWKQLPGICLKNGMTVKSRAPPSLAAIDTYRAWIGLTCSNEQFWSVNLALITVLSSTHPGCQHRLHTATFSCFLAGFRDYIRHCFLEFVAHRALTGMPYKIHYFARVVDDRTRQPRSLIAHTPSKHGTIYHNSFSATVRSAYNRDHLISCKDVTP